MGRTVLPVGTRDSFIEPGYPSNRNLDPLRNYPVGHPSALINYYATKDVLLNRTENVPTRTHNDVNFALQRDIAKGQGPIAAVRSRPWDLVTMDFLNMRDVTAPPATSGIYTVSVNDEGTIYPVGSHAAGSGNPTTFSLATAAAHQDGIAVVGLFRIDDELDTNASLGVFARGTAATDHVRLEVATSSNNANLITRATSTDTIDTSVGVGGELATGRESYLSIGLRIDAAGDTYIGVVNGEIVLDGTLSAGAQALTGNTVGVRFAGVTTVLGRGVLLFQALDLKV